ncbi:MAG: hypothetical protein CMJ51_01570 [Planctomycetaceae bacterium]|nr:hypothetical protein [Planctomycetaceae bacterium]
MVSEGERVFFDGDSMPSSEIGRSQSGVISATIRCRAAPIPIAWGIRTRHNSTCHPRGSRIEEPASDSTVEHGGRDRTDQRVVAADRIPRSSGGRTSMTVIGGRPASRRADIATCSRRVSNGENPRPSATATSIAGFRIACSRIHLRDSTRSPGG